MNASRTTYNSSTKIWSGGPLALLYHPNTNIGQVILNSLANRPNHFGQISFNNGRQMKNLEIRINAVRVAQNLDRLGLRSGDVVAIAAANHHHLASVVFGILSLAAPIHTLDPGFKKLEFSHMLGQSQPKLVICEPNNLGYVREAMHEHRLDIPVFLFGKGQDGARSVDELLVKTDMEEDFIPTPLTDGRTQTAVIVCSSGSTGLSKCVNISHSLLLNKVFKSLEPTSEDVYCTFGSIYWIAGISALISPTISEATRVITTQPFTAELLLQIIETHRVTAMFLPPFYLQQLLECQSTLGADISSVQRVYLGGNPIPEKVRQQVTELLSHVKVHVTYGMSEMAGRASLNKSQNASDTVGQLVHGVSVRVINESDENCGPNEEGELLIKNDPPILGYLNDVEANKAAFDPTGWFRTGDIGRFDDDNLLYIVGRKKDFITYHGRINPSAVENVVLSVRGVSAVCVVGLPVFGLEELPAALVVPDKSEHAVTEEQIHALIKEKLSDQNQLRGGIYFVDQIPKTPSGKVIRQEVVSLATAIYKQRQLIH